MKTKQPNFEDFTLLKFKYKDGTVETKWSVFQDGLTDIFTLERPMEIHQMLSKLLDELKQYVIEYYSFNSIKKIMGAKDRMEEKHLEAFKTIKSIIDKDLALKENAMTVTGISIKGNSKNRKVIITSIYNLEDRKAEPLNAHYLLDVDTFGTEEKLNELITAIKQRVMALIYENEKGQMNLFDDNEDQD